jgi:hypothetical protein
MALLLFGFTGTANAVDGVVLIDQNRALAGNVTPGDTAGFPVTITRSGSYRLSGNLTVPDAGTSAIVITVDNVTVDLNGFSIIGPTVCTGSPLTCSPTGSGDGVGVYTASLTGITVVNGMVRGMGNYGVNIGAHSRVENVQAVYNGLIGISISGGTVSNCTADLNGMLGIYLSYGTASDSTANVNGGTGIGVGDGTVINSAAVANAVEGISVGRGTVSNSATNGNGGHGIFVDHGTVSASTANTNGRNGIYVNRGTVSTNAVNLNRGNGIEVNRGTVSNNMADRNTGYGLHLGTPAGYASNVLDLNNGGNANPQVFLGIQMGTNVCGGDTVCP